MFLHTTTVTVLPGFRLQLSFNNGVAGEVCTKAPALKVGDCVVAVDPRYFRPTEVETLLGDPSKAKTELGWVPEITAQQMCAEMMDEDLKAAQQTALLRQHGFHTPVSRE